MDFSLEPHLHELAEEARDLGLTWAAQRPIREDSWLVGDDPEFARELGRRGWLGLTWPVEWGGGGRPPLERFVIFEALIGVGAPLATSWFADRQIGPTLFAFGSDAQRRRYLPGILSGETRWCIGMSEPDAGSDVAALRTAALPTRDGWTITGRKVWISGAATADLCYLVARTDPEAPRHAGLSEFVVDMTAPGVEVRPIADMSGGNHFCEVSFDGVHVEPDRLVGTPNGSFRQIMRQMEHERGGIDRLVSNLALYREALPHADLTRATVRQEVARIESGYRIGRLLVLREVLGQAPGGFSAATKTWCTEFEQRVTAFCTLTLGMAVVAQGPDDGAASAALSPRIARNLCFSPAYTIMGGTTNILRNIVAERILGLPRIDPRT